MRLTVLGSSGTFPGPGNPASGYLVSTGSTAVLLDVGPGVFPALRRLVSAPDAVVISHVHADHCADLFPLFNALRYGPPRIAGLPVITPRGVAERFAGFLGADDDHDLFRVLAFDEVEAGAERAIGDLRFRFGAATHPVPALVTRVESDGAALVYSGDTGPGGDLEAVATGAAVLLCEASLQGEPTSDRYPYHLHASEAGDVAARAGVGRLVVTHVPPTLDPAVSVAEAAAVFDGPVTHAVPGMEVDV
jgi:ribonuclease BN (tRNA processing enzyme)